MLRFYFFLVMFVKVFFLFFLLSVVCLGCYQFSFCYFFQIISQEIFYFCFFKRLNVFFFVEVNKFCMLSWQFLWQFVGFLFCIVSQFYWGLEDIKEIWVVCSLFFDCLCSILGMFVKVGIIFKLDLGLEFRMMWGRDSVWMVLVIVIFFFCIQNCDGSE